MFKSLYDRLIALAESPQAPYALAAVAFAESSVFPDPARRAAGADGAGAAAPRVARSR